MNPDTQLAVGLFERLGFPVALLLMVGVVFWRVLKWVRPHADRLVSAHVDLVTSLKEGQQVHENRIVELTGAVDRTRLAIDQGVTKICEKLEATA